MAPASLTTAAPPGSVGGRLGNRLCLQTGTSGVWLLYLESLRAWGCWWGLSFCLFIAKKKAHRAAVLQNALTRRNACTAAACLASMYPSARPCCGAQPWQGKGLLFSSLLVTYSVSGATPAGTDRWSHSSDERCSLVLMGICLFFFFHTSFVQDVPPPCLQKQRPGPLKQQTCVPPAGFYRQGNAANEVSPRSATAPLVCLGVIGGWALLGSPIYTALLSFLLKMLLIKQEVVLLA